MGNNTAPAQAAPRLAGVRLAINVITPSQREHVLSAFRRHEARSIEEADGIWRDPGWSDFDPVSVPHWIEPPTGKASGGEGVQAAKGT